MLKNNYIDIKYIEKITNQIKSQLILIWEDSIEHSHHFLSKKDKEIIKKELLDSQIFFNLKYLVCYIDDKMIGFLAFDEKKIEMLFLKSQYFNQGIGSALMSKALNEYDLKFVEVNKDNKQAYNFYKKFGFTQENEYTDKYGFVVVKMKL
ncbi:GNAT family N-acetyltransferase [Campylobacter volucris]|uniref:GNAT family N-acetyltransferase n=1 Tax=Campylobacter volucris TaxID=1031542 RepID=UPI00189D810F|nr:GNAT family N-acetyltransferase [Campylobacter volucris]MBF7042321.1 GNAT family N-acetyltransferase [Campylobacter volucris]